MKFRMNIIGLGVFLGALGLVACGEQSHFQSEKVAPSIDNSHETEDLELYGDNLVNALACKKATTAQISVVNQGNTKKDAFLQQCARETGGSAWCNQLIRPNPSSISVFRCTYGSSQVHQLIHPDTATWKNAIQAVRLIQELEQKGLRVCQIYNWWRPEPYNKNVGGAAGRHPYATSVDVRFCSNADANHGFNELCKYRKEGRIRAIGHYGTSALHFGMGDSNGNTWGKSCP
ncbi:MAG: hypothetical protein AB7G93_13295 [Bdellovibrionales bacterium]